VRILLRCDIGNVPLLQGARTMECAGAELLADGVGDAIHACIARRGEQVGLAGIRACRSR
jgi:hypothetical protein